MLYCNVFVQNTVTITALLQEEAEAQGEHKALGHWYHSAAAPGRTIVSGNQHPPDADLHFSKTKFRFLFSLKSRKNLSTLSLSVVFLFLKQLST